MRRRQSTAVQSYLLVSITLHVLVLVWLWPSSSVPAATVPESLEVYSVPADTLSALERDLPALEPAEPLPNSSLPLSEAQLAALPKDPERAEDSDKESDAQNFKGQIVELADPLHAQESPEDAQYLSRSNQRVEQETVSSRYRFNSSVIAPSYSDKVSAEHGEDGDSSARLQGDSMLERGEQGQRNGIALAMPSPRPPEQQPRTLSALPREAPRPPSINRPPQMETEDGDGEDKQAAPQPQTRQSAPTGAVTSIAALERPTRPRTRETTPTEVKPGEGTVRPLDLFPTGIRLGTGSGGGDDGSSPVQRVQGHLMGAPTNDRILERKGDATMLNAREFRFFGYIQLIKRQVNFYWDQALGNVSTPKEILNRSEYTTVVDVVLDSKGHLMSLALVRSCGVKAFDEATLSAFRLAAPFPPPPEGMVSNGQAHMPDFAFTVTISEGEAHYSAVDPRANVLFPGIAFPR